MRQTITFRNKILAFIGAALALTTNIYAQASLSYHPDGKDFVVVNGRNMFTKSLSASSPDYCVKTSDTPVFKLSRWEAEKTLSFTITIGGKIYHLCSAARCESRFSDGSRRYILSDDSIWGKDATIELTICPLANNDGVIIKSIANNMPLEAQIVAHLEGQCDKAWIAQGENYLEIVNFEYANHTQTEMAKTFNISQRWNKATAERIEIETPDPYISNMMGPLLSASHGSWGRYAWIDGLDFDSDTPVPASNMLPPDDNTISATAKSLKRAIVNFATGCPTRAFKMMKTTLLSKMYQGDSPATIDADAIGDATQAFVQGLFGIQPEHNGSRCIIRPGLPKDWTSAAIRTPYIIYKYNRIAGKDVYEITQNFDDPMEIVIRQNIGNGEYQDIAGSNKKHQFISLQAITHDIADAPDITEIKTSNNDSIPDGAKIHEIKIDKLFNREWHKDNKTKFAIPFRTIGKGKNIAVASTTKGFNVGFDIKVKGKFDCAFLLITGKLANAGAMVVATYNDGAQETLPISTPASQAIADYEDHCLIKMPLDSKKKLKTISIVAIADGVEVGMEAITLIEK